MHFLNRDIQGERCDIDGGVFAFPRLRGRFGFLGVDGSTTFFLQYVKSVGEVGDKIQGRRAILTSSPFV